jgi:S1-C subfamily serine protease
VGILTAGQRAVCWIRPLIVVAALSLGACGDTVHTGSRVLKAIETRGLARCLHARIELLRGGELLGGGIAVRIGASSYIATAGHVIGNEQGGLEVVLSDGRREYADVVHMSASSDVALLSLRTGDCDEIAVPLSLTRPSIGELLYLISNTDVARGMCTPGFVVADRPCPVFRESFNDYIWGSLIEATVFPGSSGHAWVNAEGEVVGIQSAIVSGKNGMSVIAQASCAESVSALRHEARGTSTVGGRFVRIWNCINEVRSRFPSKANGVYLAAVRSDGPLHAAGVPVGCLVLSIDGERVLHEFDLLEAVRSAPPRSRLVLETMLPDTQELRRFEVVTELAR